MLPDRVSNPGPLTYESGALPIALRGPLVPLKEHFRKQEIFHGEFECFLFTMLSDLIGDEVSQFLSSKCKVAYGVCGKMVGDGVESLYFQHRNSNCKAAYLFLFSRTLRCFESG